MASRRRNTVLVVDDDPGVLASLALCLSKARFNVVQASSGPEAIRAYEGREEGIDLLLTDIVMPGMFGDQVATILQNQNPDLPVIFLSGYPPDTLAPGISIERGWNFLSKPFVLQELLELIQKRLASAPPSVPSRTVPRP